MALKAVTPTTYCRRDVISWMLLGVLLVVRFGTVNGGFVPEIVRDRLFRFEAKSHGVPFEAFDYIMKEERKASVIMCATESANNMSCEMMQYNTSSGLCSLFSRYMSENASSWQGVYARIGAVDKRPCTPLGSAPDGMTMVCSGFAHGDTVKYSCVQFGFVLFPHYSSSTRRTCISGAWNGTAPAFCVPSHPTRK